MKTLRPCPLHRGGALGKYRVGDEEATPQLEQYRGMAQAPEAVIRCVEHLLPGHGLHGDGVGGAGFGGFAQEQVLEANAQLLHHAVLRQACLVVEPSVPVWRRLTGSVSGGDHEQQHSEQQESLHVTPQ
ncbi:hypothetical protein D3C80_1801700 [compost metagenome]